MKAKLIKIDELYINEENPRDEPQENEAGALKILLHRENKLFNLMKSIAKYGYEISERIIIVEGDTPQRYKVMDGNRRISCIKLLNNPDLLPSDIIDRERLLKRIKKIVRDNNYYPIFEVESVLYDIPAEEAMMKRTIQNKHTGENDGAGRLSWDYKAQSRFASDDYKNYLVDFLDNILKVERSLSTMERIFGDPDMRILLGVIVNKKKPMVQLVTEDSIKKIYYILYLIKTKQINVSDVYYKNDRKEFYDKYFLKEESWKNVSLKSNESNDEQPEPTADQGGVEAQDFSADLVERQELDSIADQGGVEMQDFSTDPAEGQELDSTANPIEGPVPAADQVERQESDPAVSAVVNPEILANQGSECKKLQPEFDEQKQAKPDNSPFLFQGIIYHGEHPGISRALFELHRLRVSTHSLSATYLTRTLLECTLQEYLVKNQLFDDWKNPGKDPSITDLLKYCVNKKTLRDINQNYQRTIDTAFAKKDHDELNSISHGKYNLPSADILWDIERRWKLLLKFMIVNLNDKIR